MQRVRPSALDIERITAGDCAYEPAQRVEARRIVDGRRTEVKSWRNTEASGGVRDQRRCETYDVEVCRAALQLEPLGDVRFAGFDRHDPSAHGRQRSTARAPVQNHLLLVAMNHGQGERVVGFAPMAVRTAYRQDLDAGKRARDRDALAGTIGIAPRATISLGRQHRRERKPSFG